MKLLLLSLAMMLPQEPPRPKTLPTPTAQTFLCDLMAKQVVALETVWLSLWQEYFDLQGLTALTHEQQLRMDELPRMIDEAFFQIILFSAIREEAGC